MDDLQAGHGTVMSAARVNSAGACVLLVVLATCCHRSVDREPLLPVPLPDLSQTDPSVRRQLQERHAAVERARGDTSTTSTDLALAFGELGRLFLAAELHSTAEPCFINAEQLAPGEMRWPYYLAHVHRARGDLTRAADDFDRALRLQPEDIPALIWNGRVDLDRGRPDAAGAHSSKALALRSDTFAARFGLGRAALDRRDVIQMHAAAHREFFLRELPLAPEAAHGAAKELECA